MTFTRVKVSLQSTQNYGFGLERLGMVVVGIMRDHPEKGTDSRRRIPLPNILNSWVPSSGTFFVYLLRVNSAGTFFEYLLRVPHSDTSFGYLLRVPSSGTFFGYLLRLPSSGTFFGQSMACLIRRRTVDSPRYTVLSEAARVTQTGRLTAMGPEEHKAPFSPSLDAAR